MSEDLQEQIQNAPSKDERAESSPAPEVNATNETEAEASATEQTEVSKPNKVQERINQLTREKYEARQEAAALEKRISELESRKPEESKPASKAPIEDDFDNYNDYQVAQSEYVAEKAAELAYSRVAAENKSRNDNAQQSEKTRELEAKKASFDKKLDQKRGNFQDFEEVAYGHKFMNQDMAERIIGMDKGPEVAYHLGSHLDVAERIFSMPLIDQAVELAKIEMQVESLNPKKVSDAPDLIKPISGHEKVHADPDKMSADQWAEWRNRDLESKGRL
ncbi:hypothetical protein [uncultured Paraglaciecola sp.]|uniref:hypothetical protein n=1 Tax=uncultured Paraglaciecola sp. TaxID=1765024 RepID=UPI00261ED64B|nr:hypothetical protein [uncultured Paraglaciecola sp.]